MTDKTTPSGGHRSRRKGYYPGPSAKSAPKAASVADDRPPAAQSAPIVAEDGESIAADRVDVSRAVVGRVDSSDVTVRQGAIGAARADRIDIGQGALGAALGSEVQVDRSYARTVIARKVEMEQTFARTVIAADVQARRSLIAVLIARRVDGDARVLIDWRGALVIGGALGFAAVLASVVRRGRGNG